MDDNEELQHLAERLLETYSLDELLEINNIPEEELVYFLLLNGWFDTETPCGL